MTRLSCSEVTQLGSSAAGTSLGSRNGTKTGACSCSGFGFSFSMGDAVWRKNHAGLSQIYSFSLSALRHPSIANQRMMSF
tara:strand:+ start:1719 stop:1958 length:240 start_codon:yes stop_codon:yes gene_type:complete